jgi:adenylate cyclase
VLNSKDILEKTGISRATLNNYISWGIVPKPDVLPPEPSDGAAPRIGYFPEHVVERIGEIQRLKREGWSMARIAEHFTGASPAPASPPGIDDEPSRAFAAPAPSGLPSLSLPEFSHPAYLVNERFELVWLNAAAQTSVLGPEVAGSGNVFAYLLRNPSAAAEGAQEVIRFHLELARRLGIELSLLGRGLSGADRALLERLYQEALASQPALASRTCVSMGSGGVTSSLCVYGLQFREGVLFAYVPAGRNAEKGASTSGRAGSAGDGKRLAGLSHFAVLVADLECPSRIWAELPAEEYFELINHIWVTLDPIFRRHHGTQGKHAGDGMVCYFFPRSDSSYALNALLAAHEMREAMRRVSKEWQLRKGWTTELYMNTGIDEGQQWLGTLNSGEQPEFTMMDATLNQAARLSDFARAGAVWATKNLLGKLSAEERQRLKYGVYRRTSDGRDMLVRSVFSTVGSLAEPADGRAERLKDIARVPVTEIVEVTPVERRRDRTLDHIPD